MYESTAPHARSWEDKLAHMNEEFNRKANEMARTNKPEYIQTEFWYMSCNMHGIALANKHGCLECWKEFTTKQEREEMGYTDSDIPF